MTLHPTIRVRRRGGAVVELAIITPVLMMILLGTIQGGYMFMVRQNVILASRAGARAAALKNSTTSDVTTAVNAAMGAANLTGYTTTTNLGSLTNSDTTVNVTVSIPFSQVSFTGTYFGGGTFNIVSTSTMRREGLPGG